ncbi:MAG TPA: hypothetical protein VJH23_05235 [archaeon]|nr:hypothetical protein [archaeon]
MRNALVFAAFLLLLASGASAVTIGAPASVPENTSWGFSVMLEPTDSWTKTSVKINGSEVLNVYSNGTITPDPYSGQFVIKSFVYDEDPATTSGLVLYVSHFGLLKGSHTISASSDAGNDSATVIAFAPLGESDKNALDSSIGALDEKTAAHDSDINELGTRINRTALDSNRAIKQTSAELEGRLDVIESKQTKMNAALLAQEEKKNSPFSGLVDLVSGIIAPLGFAIVILVVIALAVGVVLLIKSRISSSPASLYGGKDEYNLPVSKENEEMAGALAESKGKWKIK